MASRARTRRSPLSAWAWASTWTFPSVARPSATAATPTAMAAARPASKFPAWVGTCTRFRVRAATRFGVGRVPGGGSRNSLPQPAGVAGASVTASFSGYAPGEVVNVLFNGGSTGSHCLTDYNGDCSTAFSVPGYGWSSYQVSGYGETSQVTSEGAPLQVVSPSMSPTLASGQMGTHVRRMCTVLFLRTRLPVLQRVELGLLVPGRRQWLVHHLLLRAVVGRDVVSDIGPGCHQPGMGVRVVPDRLAVDLHFSRSGRPAIRSRST